MSINIQIFSCFIVHDTEKYWSDINSKAKTNMERFCSVSFEKFTKGRWNVAITLHKLDDNIYRYSCRPFSWIYFQRLKKIFISCSYIYYDGNHLRLHDVPTFLFDYFSSSCSRLFVLVQAYLPYSSIAYV